MPQNHTKDNILSIGKYKILNTAILILSVISLTNLNLLYRENMFMEIIFLILFFIIQLLEAFNLKFLKLN